MMDNEEYRSFQAEQDGKAGILAAISPEDG
jgi:hypothetical protein